MFFISIKENVTYIETTLLLIQYSFCLPRLTKAWLNYSKVSFYSSIDDPTEIAEEFNHFVNRVRSRFGCKNPSNTTLFSWYRVSFVIQYLLFLQ